MKETIDDLRQKINSIDLDILALLRRRAELSVKMGRLKHEKGLPTFDPAREKDIMDRLGQRCSPPLTRSMLEAVFSVIFSISRGLQGKKKISFLGPEGSYSHQAALRLFCHDSELIAAPGIEEVIREVLSSRAELGVVPVENSTEGIINQTLDIMASSGLYIKTEIMLPIKHCLLSNARTDEIKKIYSHPQALAQCRSWIRDSLPSARIIETASTSDAAKAASAEAYSAAIASENAAVIYGLDILESGINDYHDNITRFWVISRQMQHVEKNAKTSIIITLDNKPGSLHDAIGAFASRGINLTKIKSRPSKKGPWQYLFFIDFQGSLDDEHIRETMESLKEFTRDITVLGTYPEERIYQ